MTPYVRSLCRHALGLPNDSRRSYRNRYVAAKRTDAWAAWAHLVDVGHAALHDSGRVGDLFILTRTGAEAVLDAGESLDLEDFPHD